MKTFLLVAMSLFLTACAGFGKPPPISVLPAAPAAIMISCPALVLLAKGATPEDALLTVSQNYEAFTSCRVIVDEWINFYSDIKKTELK